MAVTIGSNISSLRTIRQLDGTTRNLASTSERLASGQRINRASDDAAGLAIASSLDAASRVFAKALANVNDGISLLAITDGAMRELGSILTRVKELATQSANGSYSSVQRRALDEEGQKLRDEYNRILATTSFNGVKTLNGSQSTVAIQAGSDGTSATLQLQAPELGEGGSTDRSNYALEFDGSTNYMNTGDWASGTFDGVNTTLTVSAWIKPDTLAGTDYIASKYDSQSANNFTFALNLQGSGRIRALHYTQNGSESVLQLSDSAIVTTGEWQHIAVTYNLSAATVTLYHNGSALSSSRSATASPPTVLPDGNDEFVIGSIRGGGGFTDFFDGRIDDVRVYNRVLSASEISALSQGQTVPTSGLVSRYNFDEGSGNIALDANGGHHGTLINGPIWSSDAPSQTVSTASATLEEFSLLTSAGALSAMETIESAFSRLSGEVGKIGSQLSRLQTIINTIAASRENYQAAAGRIKDADVAVESAALIRHEILQQTASGVLAQANQQPRIAIQLLGAI